MRNSLSPTKIVAFLSLQQYTFLLCKLGFLA